MIKLIQFPRGMGVPNPSPFCMKAEILLKMAEREYCIEELANPSKSPKGKLPYIRDGENEIADSSFILQYLEEEYGVDFDAGLDARQRATGHAIARMCEERLYWAIVYSRWVDEQNWPNIRQFWFGGMPPIIRSIVPALARKGTLAALKGHGLGRHSAGEVYALGITDIKALADLLGEQDFMLGDVPSAVDATAYAHIENLLIDMPSPLLDETRTHENLVAYRDRCRALWFPDMKGE